MMRHHRELFKDVQIDIIEAQEVIRSTLLSNTLFAKEASKFLKLLKRLPETIDNVFNNSEFSLQIKEMENNDVSKKGVKRELFKSKVQEIMDATIGPHLNSDIQNFLKLWLFKQYTKSIASKSDPHSQYQQALLDLKKSCTMPREEGPECRV